MGSYAPTLAVIFVTVAYLLSRKRAKENVGNPLPTLPRLPIIGNLHQLGAEPHRALIDIGKKLDAPVFRLMFGFRQVVVVNRLREAWELCQKQGSLTASRPQILLFNLLGNYRHLVALPYGDNFRKTRSLIQKFLSKTAVETYGPSIDREIRAVVTRLLAAGGAPVDPAVHLMLFTHNLMTGITYGYTSAGIDDPAFVRGLAYLHQVFELREVPHILREFVPLLKLLPDWDAARARKVQAQRNRDNMELLYALRERAATHSPAERTCVAWLLTEHQKEHPDFEDIDIISMCDDLIIGGTDTTAASLTWIIANLVGRRDILERCYSELDEVVGRKRPPALDDDLPYIRAVIREGGRHCPPAFLNVHQSTEATTVSGFDVPAGTQIMLNIYALHKDPDRYERPDEFNPDRFLNVTEPTSGLVSRPWKERDHVLFGWGRRSCPGVFLVERNMFLCLSRLLWAFDLQPELDAEGKPVEVDAKTAVGGLNVWPLPYRVRFVPREWSRIMLDD